jgi:hypothetical protein
VYGKLLKPRQSFLITLYSEIINQVPILLLAKCLNKIPSAEFDSFSANYKKLPAFYGTRRFITVFRTAASVFHPEPDKSLYAPIIFLEGPISYYLSVYWHAAAQLVEAQRYKPEGCGFESRWGCTMALGSSQPVKEVSTRDVLWELKPVDA